MDMQGQTQCPFSSELSHCSHVGRRREERPGQGRQPGRVADTGPMHCPAGVRTIHKTTAPSRTHPTCPSPHPLMKGLDTVPCSGAKAEFHLWELFSAQKNNQPMRKHDGSCCFCSFPSSELQVITKALDIAHQQKPQIVK